MPHLMIEVDDVADRTLIAAAFRDAAGIRQRAAQAAAEILRRERDAGTDIRTGATKVMTTLGEAETLTKLADRAQHAAAALPDEAPAVTAPADGLPPVEDPKAAATLANLTRTAQDQAAEQPDPDPIDPAEAAAAGLPVSTEEPAP